MHQDFSVWRATTYTRLYGQLQLDRSWCVIVSPAVIERAHSNGDNARFFWIQTLSLSPGLLMQ